jgi:hypothetical protein
MREQLAKKLRPYKTPDGGRIEPRLIKLDNGSVSRVYHKPDFREAWERYPFSPQESVTSVTSVTCQGKSVTTSNPVTATEMQGVTENTMEGNGSNTCAELKGQEAHRLLVNQRSIIPRGLRSCWLLSVWD